MNQRRDYEITEEKNVNINRNPGGAASFWQAMGSALSSRTGQFVVYVVIVPLVAVCLFIFGVYVWRNWKAFVADTPSTMSWIEHVLAIVVIMLVVSFGVHIARNILRGMGDFQTLRKHAAEVDRAQNMSGVLAEVPGGWLVMQPDGTYETFALPQEKIVHNYRHGPGEYDDVIDADLVEAPAPQLALPPPAEDCLDLSSGFKPHADTVLSGRGVIFGISGSGKSNTIATLSEELGRLEVPSILADTEDEYQSLNDPRWMPSGRLMDARQVNVANAESFGRYVIEKGWQVILNLQSYPPDEAAFVMANIIAGMRQWQEARASELRISTMFILDEAAHWLPQQTQESKLSDGALIAVQQAFFDDLVRRGRKRGLGLTLATQRSAEIDKRALQSNWKVLHRQTEEADLNRYAKMGISKEETLSLRDGEAFVFNSQVSKQRVQIRRRYSLHGADTPGLASVRKHKSERINFAMPGQNSFGRAEEPETSLNGFVPRMEPLYPNSERNKTSETSGSHEQNPPPAEISDVSENDMVNTGGQTWYNVPPQTRSEILKRYRAKMKRTEIRDELQLHGDHYWMVKVVCDGWDDRNATQQAKEA